VLSATAVVHAQNSEVWGDINVYKNFSHKFSLFGDAGPRFNINNQNYYGFYIRPSAAYRFSDHVMVNGGIAWFYANVNEGSLNEFRSWQGTRLEWVLWNRLVLSNYIRFEERWFYDPDFVNFLLRFRYLVGLTIPLNHKTLEAKTWYVPVAFEVFEDLNDHLTIFINRTRLYSGIGYVLNKNTRLELFYIANNSRGSRDGEFDRVNVYRLRLHFTISERPALIE